MNPDTISAPDSLAALLLDGMNVLDSELQQVGSSDLDQPTPCEGWTITDLVAHVADTADRARHLLQGTAWEASTSTEPVLERWHDASDALRRTVEVTPLVATWPVPAEDPHWKLQFHGCDFAIHSWDLAVARKAEVELPTGWVTHMDGFFRALPAEAIRRPRAFAAELPAQPGDGPTRRLMAFLGRRALT